MKKLICLIAVIMLSTTCFAKEIQVYEVDNNKKITWEALKTLYENADYKIYINNIVLDAKVLEDIKANNDTYHYIGYTDDNVHYFESTYDYEKYLKSLTSPTQKETTKPVKETVKESETTKKKTEETTKPKETTKVVETTTKKVKETTSKPVETTKPKETVKKETVQAVETTQAVKPLETTAPPVPPTNNGRRAPSAIGEQTTANSGVSNRFAWSANLQGRLLNIGDVVNAIAVLPEPSVIGIICPNTHRRFELDSSEITSDKLAQIATEEGLSNFQLTGIEEEYIYFTMVAY